MLSAVPPHQRDDRQESVAKAHLPAGRTALPRQTTLWTAPNCPDEDVAVRPLHYLQLPSSQQQREGKGKKDCRPIKPPAAIVWYIE